jgi:hypothetical protein
MTSVCIIKGRRFIEEFRDGKWKNRHYSRYLWEKLNGPIPPGLVIHHKDFDPLNDTIGNLEMMTLETHNSIHKKGNNNNEDPLKKQGMKECRLCHSIKPLLEFYKTRNSYFYACKECIRPILAEKKRLERAGVKWST